MTDVLIAGAGPVGLTLACELARNGVSFRIIDKSREPSKLSKALGIHARSLEMLERMGTIEPFLKQGLKVHGMQAWLGSEKQLLNIRFDDLDSPYPFILDLPQSETEQILIEHLAQFGVQIERQVELVHFSQTEDIVTATLRHADHEEEATEVKWLVGCDGAHSSVRHLLNLPFEGAVYPENFILADVRVSWELSENEMHLFIHEEGLLAAFPYGNNRYRLMAEVNTPLQSEKVPDPTLEEFQHIVDVRGPRGTRISDPVWLAGFRSHLRHVKETRHGKVFLAGDASHIHSPAGGQGMNTGMQDAFNLAWKLALVARGSAAESLLQTYSLERLPVAHSVLKMTDTMIKMITTKNRITQKLRNQLAPFLSSREVVQKRIRNQISEIAINYRKSPIVQEHRSFIQHLQPHHIHAGDRAPDVQTLIGPNKTEQRLFEILRGTRHALLIVASGSKLTELRLEALDRWKSEIDLYLIMTEHHEQSSHHGCTIILDPAHQLHKRYDIGPDSLILIRPDGYIGYLSDSINFDQLQQYLDPLFSFKLGV
ncbi:FAD-dependent monooxygenase [Paenibacillus xanthanilyticus]|uniref:FAD-dependent monooxygenase n=1 Tax=Paenibacillus xanthanilyticus TaxID=1783531 RepID=A0ABV8K9G4_9BACL